MFYEEKELLLEGMPSETITRKRRSHPRQIIRPRAGWKRGSAAAEHLFGLADCCREAGRFVRIGARVATEVFGFCLLIHAGVKPERRGCSLPPSETEWG